MTNPVSDFLHGPLFAVFDAWRLICALCEPLCFCSFPFFLLLSETEIISSLVLVFISSTFDSSPVSWLIESIAGINWLTPEDPVSVTCISIKFVMAYFYV